LIAFSNLEDFAFWQPDVECKIVVCVCRRTDLNEQTQIDIGAYMLTATCQQKAQFFVGDVVTLKTGGPRMTITYVGPVEFSEGDWLHCQWFDDRGELRQELFSQDNVKREPRSIPPGSMHLRSFSGAVRSSLECSTTLGRGRNGL
jgi:uncharacterized protein YodC (DUF2158 family)